MSGPLNLNEVMWRFLQLVAPNDVLSGATVQELHRYYHGYGEAEVLDLSTRLARWFTWNCNYDWEHGITFSVRIDGNEKWELQVDSNEKNSLEEDDLKVLYWPTKHDQLDFKLSDSILKGECEPALFTQMLSRTIEWLEREW